MIRSVSADKESFREVKFRKGFNVVLAEKTVESTGKDSRNGLGKSSIVEIIHFCLGGRKTGTLAKQQVNGWTFTVCLDVGGKEYSISRNTAKTDRIFVQGDCGVWGERPKVEQGQQTFSATSLARALGSEMYRIAYDEDYKYSPSFRSLLSYSIRRGGRTGGYLRPFKNNSQQREWDVQVNGAYLLGLEWRLASDRQVLRDRTADLDAVKRSITEGVLSDAVGEEGMLEANRIRLEEKVVEEAKTLENFRLHQEYGKLENEANVITEEIHDMSNMNMTDKRVLELYKASLVVEMDATPEQIVGVYKEARLLFPDAVTKNLEKVREFHKKVVQNRRRFLSSEIERLKGTISGRESEISNLDKKRANIMRVLDTHGALDEFTSIQETHAAHVSELKGTVEKLEMLRKVKAEKSAIRADVASLQQKMEVDLDERAKQRREAVTTFNSYSERLYDAPGNLSMYASEAGYKFDVRIERSGSQGVEMMQIFCYDLTLAKIWAGRPKHPGFLVHDSAVFDGVDERQIANALRLAASMSEEHEYQYICMMNSDSIPQSEMGGFDLGAYVVATFTDATSNGGLLGIRF